jgi:hypothetical protein
MRTLLSDQFKRRVREHPEAQSALGARVGLDQTRLSCFMNDQLAIGPVNRRRLVRLGAIVGLTEAECFQEVRR